MAHSRAGGGPEPRRARIDVLDRSGRPLEPAVREDMEKAFGADFSGVRIHDDPLAAQLAQSVAARAYTVGENIVLAQDTRIDGPTGRRLLAHELAHVVQQRRGDVDGTPAPGGIKISDPGDRFEREADAVAGRVASGSGDGSGELGGALAAAPRARDTTGGADTPVQRTVEGPATASPVAVPARVEDPAALEPIRMRLFAGEVLTLRELLDFLDRGTEDDRRRIAALEVKGRDAVPRILLKGPLRESWVLAKEELAYKSTGLRNTMMRKLLEFRDWHFDEILKRVKATAGQDDLKWGSEGSESLTSDIDVNLKGSRTEVAVARFNAAFRADGWAREPGVVYDVNVYAKDFMFSPGGTAVASTTRGAAPVRMPQKEGARTSIAQGGVSSQSAYERDTQDQLAWALVKARLHMSVLEWRKYVDKSGIDASVADLASRRYETYMKELETQMAADAGTRMPAVSGSTQLGPGTSRIESAALGMLPGGSGDSPALGVESLKMQASNRVYERKLLAISEQREALKTLLEKANAAPASAIRERDVEDLLSKLRSVISEAALWSNEAYVTDAAVNHTVVGLQIGAAISQTVDELLIAVTENAADAIKESRRHSDHAWEAAYKSAKYVWRMTDAAKNAGLGDVPWVDRLYRAAFEMAPVIKSGSSASVGGRTALHAHAGDNDAAKVTSVLRDLGVTGPSDAKTVEAWQQLILKVARAVQKEGRKRFTSSERGFYATPVTAPETRTRASDGKVTKHAVFNVN